MPFAESQVGYVYEAGTDEHDTPLSFFRPIAEAVGGFDLDPCASASSSLAETNWTKADDGLSMPWDGRVWMNPPYSEVSDWMEYALRQHAVGNTSLLVALVYARTDTRWYHDYARYADWLCFVKGRLTFGDGEHSAPAPSLVAVYGEPPDALVSHLRTCGHVVEGESRPTETTALTDYDDD